MTDPASLEARAVELYRCDCGAELDHPCADCPACGAEAHDPTPWDDGPDAADLYDTGDPSPVAYLLTVVVLAPFAAAVVLYVFTDPREIDALIIAAKAWAWGLL